MDPWVQLVQILYCFVGSNTIYACELSGTHKNDTALWSLLYSMWKIDSRGQCVLRNRLVDLVNLNCMKIPTVSCDVECLMCDTIEDFIKYEQHRLNIISQVTSEDMKSENKYYGNVIVLNRMCTTSMY